MKARGLSGPSMPLPVCGRVPCDRTGLPDQEALPPMFLFVGPLRDGEMRLLGTSLWTFGSSYDLLSSLAERIKYRAPSPDMKEIYLTTSY